MNSTATDGIGASAAATDDHVSTILLQADMLITECGFDVHLCHGIRANGGCSCPRGRKCPDIGKHPRGKQWQQKSTRDLGEIIRRLEAHPISNLGVRTGNGLVVFDLDLLPGGIERFAEWEAKVGPVSRGHVVQTGSGGQQIYVRIPAIVSHLIGDSQGKLGPGIDIRAKGGQVIAPPSIHRSGNPYRWLSFRPGQPPMLPQAWIDLLCELSPAKLESATAHQRRTTGRRSSTRKNGGRGQQGQPGASTGAAAGVSVAGYICSICNCTPNSPVVSRVGYALIRCQVTGSRMTYANIGRLAGGLANIPELTDKSAEELLPLVRFWFNVGRPNMSDKSWESVKRRWLDLWDNWTEPQTGPAWDAAREIVTPALLAEAKQSDHEGRFLLKAICNYIQEQAHEGLWYLACRTAMDVLKSLGIERNHVTISYWLKQLVAEGFLVKSEYRDPDCPYAIYYQTAAAVARCEEHDRQRAQQQAPALVFAPINRLARFLLPRPESAGTLADVFATAGRDEPAGTPGLMFNAFGK